MAGAMGPMMPNRTFARGLGARVALGALVLALAPVAPLAAQDEDVAAVSQPVVQPIRGASSIRLNEALARLGKDPRDVPALLDAGKAALGVGDVDAAVGFYRRADALAPNNAGVKAGLACALVRRADPLAAIPLFEQAEQLGSFDPALLSDRGLAFDLVGDNARAQALYRQVQTVAPNDENSRRLALSLAMSGDKRGMETTLAPLLQKGDKAAWRTRTFGYAVLGQPGEAEAIARTVMPANLADQIAPYLKFMPRLTRAQQAAAATFGKFPRSADIGLDDPRIAAYAAANPVRVAGNTASGTGLVPAGQPLGKPAARGRPSRSSEPAAPRAGASSPPPQVAVAETPRRPAPTPVGTGSGVLSSGALTSAPPAPAPTAVQVARAEPAPPPAPTPSPAAAPPQAQVAATPPPKPTPARRDLSDVFADLSTPSREVVPVEGAVDLRRLAAAPAAEPPKAANAAPAPCVASPAKGRKPAVVCPPVKGKEAAAATCVPAPAKGRKPAVVCPPPKDCTAKPAKGKKPDPKCEADAKPAKATQPSRIWVQVATGRNKSALAFDWKKMTREDEPVFRGRKPFTAGWGQTNRLLTGPFDSEKAADAYIAQLKKAGIPGAFTWTSPAGQAVDPLPLGK